MVKLQDKRKNKTLESKVKWKEKTSFEFICFPTKGRTAQRGKHNVFLINLHRLDLTAVQMTWCIEMCCMHKQCSAAQYCLSKKHLLNKINIEWTLITYSKDWNKTPVRLDAISTCSDRYTKKVVERIFSEKLLVNFTIIYKETYSNNLTPPPFLLQLWNITFEAFL